MKKFIHLIISSLLLLLFSINISYSRNNDFNYFYFSQIPVLHEGRIKPLDSFANIYILKISKKKSLDDLSSIHWFAELLFDQLSAYKRKIFKINNIEVLNSIGLTKNSKPYYSFLEVSSAIRKHLKMVTALYEKNQNELTLAQNQLVDLYVNSILFFDISRSVSFLLPQISIENKDLAKEINVKVNQKFSYFDIIAHKDMLEKFSRKNTKEKDFNDDYKEEKFKLGTLLGIISSDKKSHLLRIIPPQWENNDIWMSPYSMLEKGQGSPQTANYIKLWESLAISYLSSNKSQWEKASKESRNLVLNMTNDSININSLNLELIYNKTNLFYLSLILYFLSFLLIVSFFCLKKKYLIIISNILLFLGFLCHLGGVILRVLILSRPPVSNLYESIIFVGLIAVIYALIAEKKRKDGTFLLTGSIIGFVLQFISIKYSLSSDNNSMLIAVLNTNFWLATHVLTITIAYGCCFIASTISHIWVIKHLLSSKNIKIQNQLEQTIVLTCLIALFFALTGTILGGIWADQSWGRFWGWDPKENGAMLIVLWLILILHGKISKFLKSFSFVESVIFTNIIVVLAWFGVNLLNVGLHSYGFTTNIAVSVFVFCGIELLFILLSIFMYFRVNNDKQLIN